MTTLLRGFVLTAAALFLLAWGVSVFLDRAFAAAFPIVGGGQ